EVGLVGGEDAQSEQPVTAGGPVGRAASAGGAAAIRGCVTGVRGWVTGGRGCVTGAAGPRSGGPSGASVGESGQEVFAGGEQRLEVRLGASGGEDSVAVGEAEVVAGPVDQPPLHEGGDLGLVVGVDRGVDGREHRFGGDGRHGDGAVEVGDVAGVVEPHGVVGVEGVDFTQGFGVADSGGVEVDGVDRGLQAGAVL